MHYCASKSHLNPATIAMESALPRNIDKQAMTEEQSEVVVIDCEHVASWSKCDDPRFEKLYREMQASFADMRYGYRVCLHEAAHAVFMELHGVKNVRFTGPEIVYDYSLNKFCGAGARATGDDEPEVAITDEYLFTRAMHAAAGGVVLRVLKGVKDKDAGDDCDYRKFETFYQKNRPSHAEPPEDVWKRAREAVVTKLGDEEIKQKVLSKAEEYVQQLYRSRGHEGRQ